MTALQNDMLTIITMKHGWITRKEIMQALDVPGWEFTPHHVRAVKRLEQDGWIESRVVNCRWEYRAK